MPLTILTKHFNKVLALFTLLLIFLFQVFFHVDAKVTVRALVTSWLETERVNLQEGKLLSSVSKAQRLLGASKEVEGIVIVNRGTGRQKLASFGEIFTPKFILVRGTNKFEVDVLRTGLKHFQVAINLDGNESETIVFLFNLRKRFLVNLFYSIVVLVLSILFILLTKTIQSKEAQSRYDMIVRISKQIAHDIRSPISAINITASANMDSGSKELNLIKAALSRIDQMAEEILSKNIATEILPIEELHLGSSIESATREVLDEIRPIALVEKKSISFNFKIYSKTCSDMKFRCKINDLKRAISILLLNAVEAISSEGKIEVSITLNAERLMINIIDNGSGISNENLSYVGIRGFTKGKRAGNGLGVSFVKNCLASWGGGLSIRSSLEKGTSVRLSLAFASEA